MKKYIEIMQGGIWYEESIVEDSTLSRGGIVMTFKEKLAKEHPEKLDESIGGGCEGCPHDYGYANKSMCDDMYGCDECWNREMPASMTAEEAWEIANIDLIDEELLATPINSSKKNSINRAFVQMYKEWRNEKLVPPQPNGKACVRFLQEDCKLQIGVDEKTYAEFIRRWIMKD